MAVRAVIFDFDGLLCETESPDLLSWQEAFAQKGAVLPLTWWQSVVGTTDGPSPEDLLSDLIGEFDRAALRAARRQRYLAMVDVAPLCDGAGDWLTEARELGLRIGLATSSPRSWLDRHLPRLGIEEAFDCICTRDDVGQSKPAPDLYLCALERLGVAAADAVAIEDSPNGVLAAHAAGLRAVVIPNAVTAGLTFDDPDLVLRSMAACRLIDALGQLRDNVRP
jgi:HAD superfamily hydrolase (TIGR01509 family)